MGNWSGVAEGEGIGETDGLGVTDGLGATVAEGEGLGVGVVAHPDASAMSTIPPHATVDGALVIDGVA